MHHFTFHCESFVGAKMSPKPWKTSHFLSTYITCPSPFVPVNFSWARYLFLPVLLSVSSCAQQSHWPGLTSAEGIPWTVLVWRQRGATCVWDREFWSLREIKALGRNGSGKEERRGPSSWWRVGMDDRGWLLCGNCLHKSCYKVSFLEGVCCCSYLCRTRTVLS